ncbi:MAG TPA: YciI family protein [Candidatus Limnocylindrales bacterium]|nr:YciI family protein [Candidatus Limnocylindrales bacterium]
MPRYLLAVTFEPGVDETPLDEWKPEEIDAHLDYYRRLNDQLVESGELVGHTILTGPDVAKIVTSDGTGGAIVTDGPFTEFKEWFAGYQIVDVASEARAIEIAALVSAVPGPGGVPTRQPIHVRRIMDEGPSNAAEMLDYVEGAGGDRQAGGVGEAV